MKKILCCVLFALFLLPLAVMGQCGTENLTAQDAEGHTFSSVKVGPHCWLKPNLSIKLDSSKIYKSEMYPDTNANLATFGRLYNWYTTMNVQPGQSPVVGEHGFVQGICPEGWHLPTEAETHELMNYDAKTLHATEHWFVPGTNTTGFTMLPGGYYNAMKKYGENLGGDCYMWSAQSLDPSNPTVIWSDCHCEYFLVDKSSAKNGMSVRCVYKIYRGEVTTDSVKEITDQSATLYGTVAFSGYDEEYERGFVYGTDPNNLDQWAVESSTTSEETAPFNKEITGLTVATTYYYQAYIVNDFETAWGEVKDFKTLQMQVTTDSANNIKHYTATLHGTLTHLSYPSVNVGFKYGTSEDALTFISEVESRNTTGQYSANLNGLTEGTTYFFKAFTTNGTDTVYGEVKSFITKDIAVATNAATDIRSTAATLNGELTILKGYENANVGFRYGQYKDYMVFFADEQPMTSTGPFAFDLSDISPNTTYYFQAYAYNGTDTAWAADTLDFTTPTVPCLGAVRANERGTTDAIDSVLDVDGSAYITVQIGDQCWMAQNLRTTKYADGTSISLGSTTSTETAYHYYPTGSSSNVSKYGYLYNWKAVMGNSTSSETNPSGVQGICPKGWHVPSDTEWTQLTNYVSSQSEYVCESINTYNAKALASTTGWNSSSNTCVPGNNPSDNNATGFSAVPAGYYSGSYGSFGDDAHFWSATQYYNSYAYSRYVDYNYADVHKYNYEEYYGFSVRCLRDPMTVTTDSATAVTKESATLNGTVKSLGKYTEVKAGFKYGQSAKMMVFKTEETSKDTIEAYSANLNSLAPNTTYFYQAYVCTPGDTVYGNILNFTTPTVPCLVTPRQNERGVSNAIDSVIDNEGNHYIVVQIGRQCWMAQNLRCTKSPRQGTGAGQIDLKLGGSNYNNFQPYYYAPSEAYVATYGYLYNYPAVVDTMGSVTAMPTKIRRGICPEGWHVPSDGEWFELEKEVMGMTTADSATNGGYRGSGVGKLTGGYGIWPVNVSATTSTPENYSYENRNSSGFSALPGGDIKEGSLVNVGGYAYFWSATSSSSTKAWSRTFMHSKEGSYRNDYDRSRGYSVRCVRDTTAITTDSANTITKNSAKLHGNVISLGYTEMKVGFRYGQQPNQMTINAEKADAITAAGPYNVDLTTLAPNTTYYFQAYACNGTDTVWAADILDFTTPIAPCLGTPNANEHGTTNAIDAVTDYQGNSYLTVQIGNQCWMAQNLRTKVGEKTDGDFGYPTTGNDTITYGHLYSWNAVTKGASTTYPMNATDTLVHGICPAGWHVPSANEWDTLTYYVYYSTNPDYKCSGCSSESWTQNTPCIANALASVTGWISSSTIECSAGNISDKSNATGFAAIPAGRYTNKFFEFGTNAYFWSATEKTNTAWCRYISSSESYVNSKVNSKNNTGYSVRCLRDPMIVTSDSVTTVTKNSAKLYGNVISLGKYTEVKAGFRYGQHSNCMTFKAERANAITTAGSYNIDLSTLAPNTTYYFQAYACNGTDTVWAADILNFTTPTIPCLGTPKQNERGVSTAIDSVIDNEGNHYIVVQIGRQCWMAQNLRCTKSPRQGTGAGQIDLKLGGSNYDNSQPYYYAPSEAYVATYGYLYNYPAVVDTMGSVTAMPTKIRRGICPEGWHIPSDGEWFELEKEVMGMTLVDSAINGGYRGSGVGKLTGGYDIWPVNVSATTSTPENYSYENRNSSGFSALPGGDIKEGSLINVGGYAYFWSATSASSTKAWSRTFMHSKEGSYRNDYDRSRGYSVRCVRNLEPISVTTDSANNVASTEVRLHGNVTSLGTYNNVYAGFKYGTSESTLTSIATVESVITTTGRFSCDITGLSANTQYYFKTFAANGTDTVYGKVKNFKTLSFCPNTPTVTDIDNNIYNTVQIGQQCWMKENLRTTRFADGTPISLGNSKSTSTAYRYYPNNDSNTVSTYGYLYNWRAAMRYSSSSENNPSGVQGICPTGWHLPSDAEWTQLTDYVSSQSQYRCNGNASFISKSLAATSGWRRDYFACAIGNYQFLNNATDFSGVPSGDYSGDYALFANSAYFWSTTQPANKHNDAFIRLLYYNSESVFRNYDPIDFGFGVRCLRN